MHDNRHSTSDRTRLRFDLVQMSKYLLVVAVVDTRKQPLGNEVHCGLVNNLIVNR